MPAMRVGFVSYLHRTMSQIEVEARAEQPFLGSAPPPPPAPTCDGDDKINPSILWIIIILAIIFFVSGLLHLVVRFLLRSSNNSQDDLGSVSALQGQLQQLFHLHDSGVDQSFIDSLPVFDYKSITGLRNPLDCAVCLCEFVAEDKLRLLPRCSHAFHLECIDTWLLSHSTCPLCRGSLLSDCYPLRPSSPFVLIIESAGESSRRDLETRDVGDSASATANVGGGGETQSEHFQNMEITTRDELDSDKLQGTVVPVKLGKFKIVGGVAGGDVDVNSNVDGRRCFSMGSYEYILDDNSSLQVVIEPCEQQIGKQVLSSRNPGHRQALSDCAGLSDGQPVSGSEINGARVNSLCPKLGRSKRESFSISRIWQPRKKVSTAAIPQIDHGFSCQGRSMASDNVKSHAGGIIGCEHDAEEWLNNGGGESNQDDDAGAEWSLRSEYNLPTFPRRTLHWLVGRRNRVIHSSSSLSIGALARNLRSENDNSIEDSSQRNSSNSSVIQDHSLFKFSSPSSHSASEHLRII